MARKKTNKRGVPRQTVVNAFVITRVPDHGEITYEDLYKTLNQDIALAREEGFDFDEWSKLSLASALRFIIQRHLLTSPGARLIISNQPFEKIKDLPVYRNERTERYVKRLPAKVRRIVEDLPLSNPLILLAGV